MQYSFLDFLNLLGSLGLFLYGMKIMSEGLQKAAGERLRSFLSAMTSNRFLGVLTGLLVTALIQSSSATTVMVVSFVNAGLLNLVQSIGVVMGANIGTTATAWLISLLGFKVEISAVTIPLMAVGVLLSFTKKNQAQAIGEFIIGFSLLFLGLEYLKGSMPDLQSSPEALEFLRHYTGLGFGSVLIFLFIGTILTLVIQSSSATVALTLVMCAQGWIPFTMGVAMILGENIGTTITANLAALNANISAKRTAFSHLLFNVLGVIWVLTVFRFATDLVASIVSRSADDPRDLFSFVAGLHDKYTPEQVKMMTSTTVLTDPAMEAIRQRMNGYVGSVSIGLSLFHTMFNVTNTLIMVWFVPVYARICEFVIRPIKQTNAKKQYAHLEYLSAPLLSTSELSLVQVQKELARYAGRISEMLKMLRELLVEENEDTFQSVFERVQKYENITDRVEIEIVEFLTKLSNGEMTRESRNAVQAYMRCASEIESMGDSCFNIARSIHRRRSNSVELPPELTSTLLALNEKAEKITLHTIDTINAGEPRSKDFFFQAQNMENEMNNRRDTLEAQNILDLKAGKYQYEPSVYYVDDVDEYEHFADYAINVVEALTHEKH